MRWVYITAGAAGTHCGSCARDAGLARALIARGHEVLLMPLYTPLEVEGPVPGGAPDRVFLSGIAAWLDQVFPWFRRRKPGGLIDRFFDHPRLLRLVSRFAIETEPEKLGAMTVSVLEGERGAQAGEIRKFLDFLERQPAADVIHLSNGLLSALAPALRRRFAGRIVCAYQGEEVWISRLGAPWAGRARDLIRRHAGAIDCFLAPSRNAVADAAALFGVSEERVRVLPPCIDPGPYDDCRHVPGSGAEFRIGYLSRIVPEKGLLDLAEAAAGLAQDSANRVRLRVAGPVPRAHKTYFGAVVERLRHAGNLQFDYAGDVEFEEKKRFLQGCDVFCIPSRQPERRGMAVLEAMACGLPVVLPRLGVYIPFIEKTGGGILAPPARIEGLKQALGELAEDPQLRARMGRNAASGVRTFFSAAAIAASYETLASNLR